MSKDITKCFNRSSKKKDLSGQSKEGNNGDVPKKIGEGSVSEMSYDVFVESLKSPACVEILFKCLKNVEKQMKVFCLSKINSGITY